MCRYIKNKLRRRVRYRKKILQVTPGFSDFLGIQFLEGNEEMFFSNPLNVLISEREAKKKFPDKSPLGESMKFSNTRIRGQSFSRDFFAKEYNTSTFYHFDKDYTVNGIVKEFPPHTDFQFDYIIPYRPHDENAIWSFHIFCRLKEGVDCKTLENKWKQEVLSNPPAGAFYIQYHIDTLYPLEKLHYSWSHQLFGQSQNLTLQQILILAGVGLISILCLLFNYLSLFITRLQQKKRELALQIALGGFIQTIICSNEHRVFVDSTRCFCFGMYGHRDTNALLPGFCRNRRIFVPDMD